MEAEDRADAWLHARYQAWIAEGHALLDDVRTATVEDERGLAEALLAYDAALASAAGGAGMWSFHGLVFGKQADHDLLAALGTLPTSDRCARVVTLVQERLRVADIVERMWALYDRLTALASTQEVLQQEEIGSYVSWLGELGIDGGEVTVAAAELGVAVLEPQ